MSKKLKKKGIIYKGSGKDPAVRAVLDKLIKDGAGSLDSSGMGHHMQVNIDSDDTKRRNRSTG